MRTSSFSKNEIEYLTNKEAVESKYPKNYIYQIRHSIVQKIKRMGNDLEALGIFRFKFGSVYGKGLDMYPIIKILREYYGCTY